jgi:hypothetical protein
MTTLILLSILSAHAEPDATLPTRPTTFVVDDRLSSGTVENFREIYLDASSLFDQLEPIAAEVEAPAPVVEGLAEAAAEEGEIALQPDSPPSIIGILPILNDSSSWAEVVIGEVKIGVIGPLTNGAIHGVKSGNYQVQLTIMNGYSFTREVATVEDQKAISPGGEGARPELEAGEVPTWNEDSD